MKTDAALTSGLVYSSDFLKVRNMSKKGSKRFPNELWLI